MKNLIGCRFANLLVVTKTKRRIGRKVVYKCLCDCGKNVFVRSDNLTQKHTKSCGCLIIKHGHARGSRTREYKTWHHMIQRCYYKKDDSYKNYGGRGIKVYYKWRVSFVNFLNYLKNNNMFPKPVGKSIDRVNNDGNYCPGNIRWATLIEQRANQRISNIG